MTAQAPRPPRPPRPSGDSDVVVVGGGPAGWSAARACAARGLVVTLLDPRPDARWPQTFGSWSHELPADLPTAVTAARGRGVAIAVREHRLDDTYTVLDTAGLQEHLRHPDVRVRAARAVASTTSGDGRPTVVLGDGSGIRGRVVLDASGSRQVLARPPALGLGRDRRAAAEQTAYGVVVDTATARRVTGGRLLFMDWRPHHGRPGWPTFLYAVPLDADRVLLEETSLARRPGLPIDELRSRLHARLRAHGLSDGEVPAADDRERTERVRFAVDRPDHRSPPGVVPLGAAVPLIHPATGYSLAASLALAPRVADALVGSLDGGSGDDPAAAARAVVRSPGARAVHRMRRRGLDVLLRMPPARVPSFFDHFFALPTPRQRAYLGARDDVPSALAAMLAVFTELDPALRLHLIAGTLLGPGRARTDYSR